jgi:Fe-S oxidoreductase
MKKVYAPGCAMQLYKPELGKKIYALLNEHIGGIDDYLICCRLEPKFPAGIQVINTCTACDQQYRKYNKDIDTISLWEVLVESKTFPFPDYEGKEMAIQDACFARDREQVHHAVRLLLERMNIKVIEPEKTRTKSTCCGDSFYGALSTEKVKMQMKKRADEMPVNDVAAYCVSCCKALHIGGKKPHHIADLLFGEDTSTAASEPDEWHAQLDNFIMMNILHHR